MQTGVSLCRDSPPLLEWCGLRQLRTSHFPSVMESPSWIKTASWSFLLHFFLSPSVSLIHTGLTHPVGTLELQLSLTLLSFPATVRL